MDSDVSHAVEALGSTALYAEYLKELGVAAVGCGVHVVDADDCRRLTMNSLRAEKLVVIGENWLTHSF